MTEMDETIEKIRILFNKGFSTPLPEHELTESLIKNIYPDDEALIVATSFNDIREYLTAEQIGKKTGITDVEKLRKKLDHMVYKGSLMRGKNSTYYMFSYLPGIFETYFTAVRDIPERLKEAGKAHRGLIKMNFRPGETWPMSPPTKFNTNSGWRFAPTIEPVLNTIEINESIEVKNEILPYEILEESLSKYEVFSETPCSCREAAKFAGEPCERTTENFCIQAGEGAIAAIKSGVGVELNYEQAMKRLKKAEMHGLIHSTTNQLDPSGFICNCCPCCCSALSPVLKGFRLGVTKSNFDPVIDHESCVLCDTCVDICPMGIISHEDGSEGEKIEINLESCLGCGLCASNCPEDAISLEKTRNQIPIQSMGDIFS